jgi:anti-sigma factor RsiW
MAERHIPDDEQIQDYIDNRLDEPERSNVAAFLEANPEIGDEVERLRQQNHALRSIGQEILDEPVPDRLRSALSSIDREILNEPVPEKLRATLKPPRPALPAQMMPGQRSYFMEMALALLLFVAGGGVGWLLHSEIRPPVTEEQLLARQIEYAYGFYDRERDYPLDFPADRVGEFDSWISRSFERQVPPPDLARFDFALTGGRMVPTVSTPVGLFQFENADRQRLGVFFWRSGASSSVPQLAGDNQRLVRIWVEGDLHLAVIADPENQDFESISDEVTAFYQQNLTSH